jgi:hypothetical protein
MKLITRHTEYIRKLIARRTLHKCAGLKTRKPPTVRLEAFRFCRLGVLLHGTPFTYDMSGAHAIAKMRLANPEKGSILTRRRLPHLVGSAKTAPPYGIIPRRTEKTKTENQQKIGLFSPEAHAAAFPLSVNPGYCFTRYSANVAQWEVIASRR